MSRITAQALYFGKLPSRGDFVRSTTGSALIPIVDEWLSQTLALWIEDTGWKSLYDAAAPVHFAIVSTQSHGALAGNIATSQDASGRRFPFLAATSFEVLKPEHWIGHCPHALAPVWIRLDAAVRQALSSPNFADVQGQLASNPAEMVMDAQTLHEPQQQFLQALTLAEFEAVLVAAPEQAFSARQALLALGLLLAPVLAPDHSGVLEQAVVFPLPLNPRFMTGALTFWVYLVSLFFKKKATQLAMFVTSHGPSAVLVVGFQGASPVTLRSVLDAQVCQKTNVAVSQATWVEDKLVDAPPALRTLSNLLRDPALSLQAAVESFNKAFLDKA
jgi:type VI secretion system protein ImpM